MEYWYSEKISKVERIESEILGFKHPEKLVDLEVKRFCKSQWRR